MQNGKAFVTVLLLMWCWFCLNAIDSVGLCRLKAASFEGIAHFAVACGSF
jgi:hypothetical protein